MTEFIRQWNPSYEGSPRDNDFISEGAARIRETRQDVGERLEVEHSFAGDGNDGLHKKVTLLSQPIDPPAMDGAGIFYTKTVNGSVLLFYRDAAGGVTQVLPFPDLSGDLAALETTVAGVQQDVADNTAAINAINSVVPRIGQAALIQLTAASGVAGPQWATGTWQIVPFNTLANNADNIVALASNRFRPVAGVYLILSAVMAGANGGTGAQGRTRLWNHTTGTQVCQGNNVCIVDGNGISSAASNLTFVLSANGTDEYEVQIYAEGSSSSITALGAGTEVYGTLSLVRIVA